MVHKTCAKCNVSLGDVHGNTKWCERCRRNIRLENMRNTQQKYRDHKNQGTLIVDHTTLSEKTAIIPTSFNSFDQFAVMFQDVLEHFSFSFNQQLLGMKAEILEQQNGLAIKFDEMEFALKQNPEYNKRLRERKAKLKAAIQAYLAFGNKYPLNKIRKFLEQTLQISKPMAEQILKEAVQRVEFDKDPDQSDLSEFSGG